MRDGFPKACGFRKNSRLKGGCLQEFSIGYG